ncbi:retinol dehydrogenase 7, partial [Biomphalaria glabrata]
KEMYSRGVKVILLEPGGFKTQMINVDKIIDGIQTTLDNAPEELSSQFKGFLKK